MSVRDFRRPWIKWCAAILGVLMLRVWTHVEAQRMEGELKQLRLEADRLTYENGRLQMQIHQWISPSHLDLLAKQQYGLGPIDVKHVIGLQP